MSTGEPTLRATSAGVTKMPDPTMPPITISVASGRPMRRDKTDAGRDIWGTVARGSRPPAAHPAGRKRRDAGAAAAEASHFPDSIASRAIEERADARTPRQHPHRERPASDRLRPPSRQAHGGRDRAGDRRRAQGRSRRAGGRAPLAPAYSEAGRAARDGDAPARQRRLGRAVPRLRERA